MYLRTTAYVIKNEIAFTSHICLMLVCLRAGYLLGILLLQRFSIYPVIQVNKGCIGKVGVVHRLLVVNYEDLFAWN